MTPAPEPGTIMVSGTGRVLVEPDVADLRLGVTIARQTVQQARADGAAIMDAILAAVDAAGVATRDVRTAVMSIHPRHDYREGSQPALVGYELANIVEVTVRELDRLAEVVDGSLGAGATSMDSLSFRLADPAPAEREARQQAMAEARARAEVLAESAQLSIAGVTSVVEGAPPSGPMPFGGAERAMLVADSATPVASGAIEVTVTVTVTYRAS